MAPLESGLAATDEHHATVVASEDDRGAVSTACRVRVLTAVALGPLITGYAAVAAVLALVTSVASRAHFTTLGVLTSAAPGWLAAHQVPLRIDGRVLGVLPLLPTIVAVVLIARTAAGAVYRLRLHTPVKAAQVVVTIAAAHAVFGVALGLWCADGPVSAQPLTASCYPALLAAAASTAGVARPGGLLDLVFARIDEVAVRGLRVGVFAVAALLAAGALTLCLGLITSLSEVQNLFSRNASGPGSGLGMLLLSAAYLPNAIIAGTSFVAGSGFAIGAISVAPLNFTAGEVPGVPLLAALPEHAAAWWPVLLVFPVGVGVLAGRSLRDVAGEPLTRLRAVAVATGVVALCLVILAGSAGGALGGGRFDPVDLRAASLSVALLAWVGITAAAVAWFGGAHPEPDGPAGLLDDDDGAEEYDEADPEDDEADPVAEDGDEREDEPEDLASEVD